MNKLLETNPDYLQALSRYEQETAQFRIDKSLNWFDLNFIYKQYDNDYTRDQIESDLEHSNVNEKDKRWRIELAKQLFPKDFDDAGDAINFNLNLIRYEQEMMLMRFNSISAIFDELIEWHEATRMIELIQERLEILYLQNKILEELDQENIIDPETMILLLEEIDTREDEMYDFKEIYSLYQSKYSESIEEFYDKFQLYIQQNEMPDTLLFSDKIAAHIENINLDVQKISNKIKWYYYYSFLPEVNLTLSYNWRKTNQDWDITKNGNYENMLREQNEEFPEGEIELSLPFNIFSNTSGKLALLKAYERELDYRSREMQQAWKIFELKRITFFQEARLELKRKTRLNELYERELNLQKTKYKEEPSLLGSNPKLKLNKKNIQSAEAELKMKLAEMKYYKEIFLIKSFGDETK